MMRHYKAAGSCLFALRGHHSLVGVEVKLLVNAILHRLVFTATGVASLKLFACTQEDSHGNSARSTRRSASGRQGTFMGGLEGVHKIKVLG